MNSLPRRRSCMGRRRRPLLRWMRGTRPWWGGSKLAWREHGSRCVILWPWSHRIGRGCELRGPLQCSRRLLLLLLMLLLLLLLLLLMLLMLLM